MAASPRAMEGNTDWAARYARELRGIIVRQATLAPRSQQVHLGPSELGVSCDRQIVGKLARVQKTNNISDPWPSIVGTSVHAWLAEAFREDNEHEHQMRWAAEVPVTPHPDYGGTADLYDAWEKCVCDHKVLGATSLNKIKSRGPSRKYQVQLILYGAGFRLLGLPVERVALAAYPRTAATLDGMYVWDHVLTAADDELVREVLERTQVRKLVAQEVIDGRMNFMQVPATPDQEECFFCPFYRAQSAYDGGPGCPGLVMGGTYSATQQAGQP